MLDISLDALYQPAPIPPVFARFTEAEIEALAGRYRGAKPFPHLVLDDLFNPRLLENIEAEFSSLDQASAQIYDHALQTKRSSRTDAALPEHTQSYFNHVYSGPFIRFLTQITGIAGLLPDPSLLGGGMHEIRQGGRFDIHVDFQKHRLTGLDNRFVLITYLNKDWREEYGGLLELWGQNPPECLARVAPEFGRTLIMEVSGRSAHGHPEPVNAPDGRSRRSVAAYYYTNGRDDGVGGEALKTMYMKRSGRTARQRAELLVQQITPPILASQIMAVRRYLRS